MGCNCKKREPIVQNQKPIIEEFDTQEIDGHILVPTDMKYDWYNNIDEIEPIKPKEDE